MLFYLLFFQDSDTWAIFIILSGHQWIRDEFWDILQKYFSGKFSINKDID